MVKVFQHEANFIKLLLTHPCADPFFILIETFLECLPELVVNCLWFTDLGNIGEEAGRAVMPGKVGLRRGHLGLKTVYEEEKGLLNKTTLRWLKGAMWVMEPLDFIGGHLMVYFALDNLFYRWHSLLIEREYCSRPAHTGPLQYERLDFPALFTATGDTPALTSVRQNRAGWSTNQFGFSVPFGNYHIIASFTTTQDDNIDKAECWVQLVITDAFGIQHYDSPHSIVSGNGATTFTAVASFCAASILGAQITWKLFTAGTIVQSLHTDARVIAMQSSVF